MKRKYYLTSTVNGYPVSIYVTKKGQIMPTLCTDDNVLTVNEAEDAIGANGFNCCFNISSDREFAKSCHFNNILITKNYYYVAEEGDESFCDDYGEECSYHLSELRVSKAKQADLFDGVEG